MNNQIYLNKKEQLIKNFAAPTFKELMLERNKLNDFNLVSSILSYLLPEIEVSFHDTIFRNMLTHQALSGLEQAYPEMASEVGLTIRSKRMLGKIKKSPHIIASFHTASYRLLNHLLKQNDIPYTLVISKGGLQSQGEGFVKLCETTYGESFKMIDAEAPGALFAMIKELKAGKSLLIYLDGNTGGGGKQIDKEKLASIDFLNSTITVRKGTSYLSHISNTPIISSVCYRDGFDKIHIDFPTYTKPDPKEHRDVYAQKVMQFVYSAFGEYVKKYPDQWEAWTYLYKNIPFEKNNITAPPKEIKYIKEETCSPQKLVKFNLTHYSLFTNNKKYFVMDKHSFLSYPLEKEYAEILIGAMFNPFDLNSSKFDATQLYKENLLITV
jgi:lauroyl/myristoyl acyltransferase